MLLSTQLLTSQARNSENAISFNFSLSFSPSSLKLIFSPIYSIDAVSDRDFVLEFLAANSIAAVHLSRIGEEWVLWASEEFGFLTPSDKVSTGSSIMPQKKNPDPMELVRGKSARVVGDLMTVLTLCKGLPQAYNRDLQVSLILISISTLK